MIDNTFVQKFRNLETPFYYYDLALLRKTLSTICNEADKHHYHVHYALKANTNTEVLKEIKEAGLGADCVSGGEIRRAIEVGIPASKIVFAGVGKADWEINLALENDISCFNVESIPEMEVINQLASEKGKKVRIAFRINPNVAANTHHYITTGLNENKFGIAISDLPKVIEILPQLKNLELIGIHFHIGSQITDMTSFQGLCLRLKEVEDIFTSHRILLEHINVGGGLGIDYENPNENPIPDFVSYFNVFKEHLNLRSNQQLHFELGRSVVAQCGSLITKALYVKEGTSKKFLIVDAGMSDLIRPALYQAHHFIENLTSDESQEMYDVVGPICESSDAFAKNYHLNKAKRGDLIAIRSAGAYGEVMASSYNLRQIPKAYTSENLK